MVPEEFRSIPGIGNIPADWECLCADKISKKITKGTTPPKKDIAENGSIPFLRVNNLSFNGTLNLNAEIIFVSKAAHESFLARSKAFPGDILMNIVGPPLGKTALLGDEFLQYNMNQAIVFYRLDTTYVDGGFR